ncbi:hypothetical protein EV361DRAFT_955851 [Lentinula raphanica]|nr:hypothetical protein F5880DRAFT_1619154 [Lentinula raphanica]KAJ3964544.1 hypothetical protein EV361DRAFT_955851 [Lentinula raphanica]
MLLLLCILFTARVGVIISIYIAAAIISACIASIDASITFAPVAAAALCSMHLCLKRFVFTAHNLQDKTYVTNPPLKTTLLPTSTSS